MCSKGLMLYTIQTPKFPKDITQQVTIYIDELETERACIVQSQRFLKKTRSYCEIFPIDSVRPSL